MDKQGAAFAAVIFALCFGVGSCEMMRGFGLAARDGLLCFHHCNISDRDTPNPSKDKR